MIENLLVLILQAAPFAITAFIISVVAALVLAPLAHRVGLLDQPGGRKTHAAPTPLVGGLIVALAALGASALGTHAGPPIGFSCAALLLLVVGVVDDLRDLSWRWRLAAQTAAALMLVFIDGVQIDLVGPVFGLSPISLGAFSIPFTVLATVGVINALNMADGMDGLAGGLAACALLMLAAAAAYSGSMELAFFLLVVFGAVLGFLVFNMRWRLNPRARIFLGNSGSELIGLVLVWATIVLTQADSHPVSPVLAPFLIAPPVIDCLVLLARRIRNGVSPFSADRNHLHHLLSDAGYSATGVVFMVCGVSLLTGLAAALALKWDAPQPALLAAFGLLTVGYGRLTASRARAVRNFSHLRRLFAGRFIEVSSSPRQSAPKTDLTYEPAMTGGVVPPRACKRAGTAGD